MGALPYELTAEEGSHECVPLPTREQIVPGYGAKPSIMGCYSELSFIFSMHVYLSLLV